MAPETNENILKRIISSELVESTFKPQFWYPSVLDLGEIFRILKLATAFYCYPEDYLSEKQEQRLIKVRICKNPNEYQSS